MTKKRINKLQIYKALLQLEDQIYNLAKKLNQSKEQICQKLNQFQEEMEPAGQAEAQAVDNLPISLLYSFTTRLFSPKL